MTDQEQLHRLIDRLPESEWHTAERFLRYLCDPTHDPLLRLLDEAPEDDEVPTSEEEEADREGWEAYRRGDYRSWEEVREKTPRE